MGSGLGWGCTLVHSLAHLGMYTGTFARTLGDAQLALDVGKKSRAAHGQLPGTLVHLVSPCNRPLHRSHHLKWVWYHSLLCLKINTNAKNTIILNTKSNSTIVNYMNMSYEDHQHYCFRRHLQIFRFIQSSPRILQHPPCPLSFAVKHHHRKSFV